MGQEIIYEIYNILSQRKYVNNLRKNAERDYYYK